MLETVVLMSRFNRDQSLKLIRGLSEKDKTAFVLKNGNSTAVVLSESIQPSLIEWICKKILSIEECDKDD